jgi:putative NADH-flavin reductase
MPATNSQREKGIEMRIAIIGAAGKTGIKLVRQSLGRGHEVVAVCRDPSAHRLAEFAGRDDCVIVTAAVVSDVDVLTRALGGCDAVVAVLITARRLRATELVASLATACAATGVQRLVFTAGEVTAVREEGETYTLRQQLMITLVPPLLWLTPYSMSDMLRSSERVAQQPGWQWTIVRAPTLTESPAEGYRLCDISEVTSRHTLSREDYAACMVDSLTTREHHGRTLTVVSAKED